MRFFPIIDCIFLQEFYDYILYIGWLFYQINQIGFLVKMNQD